MATYAELLQNENWLKKRKEILNRDKRICQNCHNDHYYSNFKKSKITNIECLYSDLDMEFNLGDDRRGSQYIFSANFLRENNQKGYVDFYTYHFEKKIAYLKNYNVYYKENIAAEDNIIEKSKVEILCINNPENSNEVFFCKDLHVHHKYYRKGLNPWEYPNDALTTLCWHCHEELHENTEVAIYDENGKLIGSKSRCYKCHGSGFLPEYSYHMNGICFACNGGRFK